MRAGGDRRGRLTDTNKLGHNPHGRFRVSPNDLITAQRPGYALARDFYVDAAIYARDLDLLMGRWTWVGHASEVAAPGDWITG